MTDKVNEKPEQQHHFFCSTVYNWIATEKLSEAVEWCGNQGDPAQAIMYVPLPLKSSYEINSFRPQVDGVIILKDAGQDL